MKITFKRGVLVLTPETELEEDAMYSWVIDSKFCMSHAALMEDHFYRGSTIQINELNTKPKLRTY